MIRSNGCDGKATALSRVFSAGTTSSWDRTSSCQINSVPQTTRIRRRGIEAGWGKELLT